MSEMEQSEIELHGMAHSFTSVRWTLEDTALGMTVSAAGTLSRTANTQEGTVTLTGTVYENGAPTSARVSKEITVEDNLVTSVVIQGSVPR